MRKQNDRLEDSITVSRVIRKNWIHKDTQKVQAVAFYRHVGSDDDGVSDSESPENAVKQLKKVNRAAQFLVADIRSIKIASASLDLDIISDPQETDPVHALITGLPFYEKNGMAGNEAADAILNCSSFTLISVAVSSAAGA